MLLARARAAPRSFAEATALLVTTFALTVPGLVCAAGTPAGTDIVNQATATYTVGGTSVADTSNSVVTKVAELLDVVVTWQDAGSVTVAPGETQQVLTFLVTNVGNGSDSYTLSPEDNLSGDDFDPVFVNLFLDSNGNGSYDPGVDVPYVPGANDPVLAADASIVIFGVNDIPGGLSDGDTGNFQLTATSQTGSGAPGTVIPGGGDNGTNAVVGGSGGSDADIGTYAVSLVVVTIVKSAAVRDPFGGVEPVPGATIIYTLTITVAGSGTADDLVVADPVPVHTTYAPGTLRLDGISLSDGADGDAGDVGGTQTGVVTVNLGNVAAGAPQRTVTFAVTIS